MLTLDPATMSPKAFNRGEEDRVCVICHMPMSQEEWVKGNVCRRHSESLPVTSLLVGWVGYEGEPAIAEPANEQPAPVWDGRFGAGRFRRMRERTWPWGTYKALNKDKPISEPWFNKHGDRFRWHERCTLLLNATPAGFHNEPYRPYMFIVQAMGTYRCGAERCETIIDYGDLYASDGYGHYCLDHLEPRYRGKRYEEILR